MYLRRENDHMRKYDTEAHFLTKEYQAYLQSRKEVPREEMYKGFLRLWFDQGVWEPHAARLEEKLLDLGDGRIRDMDESGIDVQILSLTAPGCEQFSADVGTEQARKANDVLAQAVRRYPGRFIGLAALAPQNPTEAAKELERCVKELGFKGAKINSHVGLDYLDEEKYWPIFEVAEKLDVPIHLHPVTPHPTMLGLYAKYGFALSGPVLGFGAETALHALRLIFSGLFDRYPRLKIILGHLGEGLVFWIWRIDFTVRKPWIDEEVKPRIKKAPSQYIRDNFVVTTSGMFATPAFMSVLHEIGADRIMFAVDYPYESNEEAVRWLEQVPIPDIDKERVAHVTADRLLKLG